MCRNHFTDCRDPPLGRLLRRDDRGSHVMDDSVSHCDEFFFDLTEQKAGDMAISFRGLLPSVIEDEEIELVDGYKYVLMTSCAWRHEQKQSVQTPQQHLFSLLKMIPFF